MRILGIDPGEQRIGVAMSDEDAMLASPLATIDGANRSVAAKEIAALFAEHRCDKCVVGLPIQMDGTEGRSAKRARQLGEKLTSAGLTVIFWDERMSTSMASRMLHQAGKSAKKQKSIIDQAAAVVILQAYLDSHGA